MTDHRCSRCGRDEPEVSFSLYADSRYARERGLVGKPRYWCKPCSAEKARDWYHGVGEGGGKQVKVRLSWEDTVELEYLAQVDGVSVTEIVRGVVQRYVDTRRRVRERMRG